MPLLVVESQTVKQEDMRKLSYWHKANVATSVRETRLQWIASEEFFRTNQSYPLQKDWSDIINHLPKAGMVTEGLLYPLQTSLNVDDADEDEDGNYCTFSDDTWDDYVMDSKEGTARLKVYPTPTKEDYRRRGPNSRQQGLPEIVHEEEKRITDVWQKWPTPTRNDTAANRDIIQQSKRNSLGLAEVVRCYPEGDVGKWSPIAEEVAEKAIIGQLNPVWVEWLMGFPSHWSKADPAILELNKCR